MDRDERVSRLRQMLKKVAPADTLESLKRDPLDIHESLESMGEAAAVAETQRANKALETLDRGAVPEDRDLDSLEAIILPRERPVVFVNNNTFDSVPEPWTHFGTDAKTR